MVDLTVSSVSNGGVESSYRARPPPQHPFNFLMPDGQTPRPWNGGNGIGSSDRRFAFNRNRSFKPHLLRSDSYVCMVPSEGMNLWEGHSKMAEGVGSGSMLSALNLLVYISRTIRSGNRQVRRLALMISLNVAYSTVELMIGLVTGRVGLVSDAFHLTFGCGLLTFSLFAMIASQKKPDGIYTYGYKRFEVLAAFTNATAVSAVHVLLLDSGSVACIYTR